MGAKSISVIILTFNESKHLQRCLDSLTGISDDLHVLDSFSTDDTAAIAGRFNARVTPHAFVNQAQQFQWGLDNLDLRHEWVMRMDADEYLEPGLVQEIQDRLNTLPPDVHGIYLKRKVLFKGKWIRHGGFYPQVLLRIWRKGSASIEQRWMDEHIVMERGKAIVFREHLVDYNLNSVHWWIDKHNNYAIREMFDLVNIKYKVFEEDKRLLANASSQAKRKRFLKEKVYASLSPGFRAFSYFAYRYFLRMGFLDGFNGFVFHFIQGFWYRLLVDVNFIEFENKVKEDRSKENVLAVLTRDYGLHTKIKR